MKRISLTILTTLSLIIGAAGCGDGHGEHCTSLEEAMCEGVQIRMCDGAHYGDPQDCPEGQGCMTMESGLTHCMPSAMIDDEAHAEGHEEH